ncbi:MAG: DUF502 domain-containing protein [Rhodospirillaceae bacterium]|nr:DUF502 domain-containing protein [Rhodospirillaceae bacterium]
MSEPSDRPSGAPVRLRPRVGARLRAYLIAGVLVTAPIGVTLWIAWTLIGWIDGLAQAILPARYNLENYLPFFVPGFGILVLACLLTLIGMLAAGYVGRLGLGLAEAALARMPVIRGIYTAAKQIFASVLASRSSALRQVVLVEAPRSKMWSLGFLTGPTRGEVAETLGADFVNVVVPNAPNPTTAYLMFVPRRDIVPLAMSAEEAIKLIISGGIVTPEPRAEPDQRA